MSVAETETKVALRKFYLARQRALTGDERTEKSRQIAARFFERFDLSPIDFLHVFLPIEKNREVETAFVYQKLWADFPNLAIVVARVDFQTMTLENWRFSNETKLVKNRWHIREPVESERTESERIEIELLDVCLIPLLCFDQRGFRVGYGKGFYDKFLSECREDCLKIGLSYFAPIAAIADAQSFDVPLDFCVTPERVFSWQSATGNRQ